MNYYNWKGVIPLPSEGLMGLIGSSTLELFYLIGEAWAETVNPHIPRNGTVLDIGCGCGAKARFFMLNPTIRKYIGFDCHKESIEWCHEYLSTTNPAYEFHYADIHNDLYNPKGTVKATEYRFPAEDGSIDVAYAGSVFTHLLEPAAHHYLREIHRCLKPCGTAILSTHCDTEEHYSGTENRIDIRSDYFEKMLLGASLKKIIEPYELCGQQLWIVNDLRKWT